MVREDTEDGKKMRAKGGAASAPRVATTPTGDVPNNWDDQWNAGGILGQDGSGNTRCGDSKISEKGASEVGLGPGEELDNPNWINKVSDKDFDALQLSLLPKQKIEVLSCQQLFKELLETYNIDGSIAQSWEDNGVPLQDIIKWCSLGLMLEQAKQWLLHHFTVDAATEWCHTGIETNVAAAFCKHQVPRDEVLAWINTGLPLDPIAYIARFRVPFVQAEPWIANRYTASETFKFIKSGLPGENAVAILELGLSPSEAKEYS
ncbi:hypothetical protein DSO57_1001850 [Entomophthora muscae]|uniref:Uncharacterized protein n=1 Tax=Entomophthora muscae TaxID=34485 RepID=A0ACC2SY50_9FUNG|nr:hypothetical protein DSO57_1001850 [Entomophthora muscae]